MRPFIEPAKRPFRVSRISAGSAQLLVGPASASDLEQMKVRSSTRATSAGSERTRYELGRISSLRRSAVPEASISRNISSYSSWDPSQKWIRSGWQRAAIFSRRSPNRKQARPYGRAEMHGMSEWRKRQEAETGAGLRCARPEFPEGGNLSCFNRHRKREIGLARPAPGGSWEAPSGRPPGPSPKERRPGDQRSNSPGAGHAAEGEGFGRGPAPRLAPGWPIRESG